MKNLQFRQELEDMLKREDIEDEEIIKMVLEHAWYEWTAPLLIWFFTRVRERDLFNDREHKEVEE